MDADPGGLRYSRVYCAERSGSHPDCALRGNPGFSDHPRAGDSVDQKAYYEWIKRAYLLGQRLVVVKAAYSHGACESTNGFIASLAPGAIAANLGRRQLKCNVNDAVLEQISATKNFVRWVAEHDGGWLEVAYTPQSARRIIENGKMAVVLGVEVDDLFRCAKSGTCTAGSITKDLQKLWSLGVRQITPIHGIDNAFGGSGFAFEAYGYANFLYNKRYFSIGWCSGNDTQFTFLGIPGLVATDPFLGLAGVFAGYDPKWPPRPAGARGGHCNNRGLTALGEHLVTEMMRLGILIDVDHMSMRSFDDVHALVTNPGVLRPLQRTDPYPLISSHAGVRSMRPMHVRPFTDRLFPRQIWYEGAAEWHKTSGQLRQIRATGGMVAPILFQFDNADYTGNLQAPPNDCRASSTAFAQTYLTLLDAMNAPVGVGTDVNGRAPFPGPRLGPEACLNRSTAAEVLIGAQAFIPVPQLAQTPQHGGVDYGTAVIAGRTISRSVTGNKSFDVGTDGVAHYGMVADLFAELENLGMDARAIDAFYSSAERYLQVWASAAPAAAFDIRPIWPTYLGISDHPPELYLERGHCIGVARLPHPARWWEFEIELDRVRGFHFDPQASFSAISGAGTCTYAPGPPDEKLRVAFPVAPVRDPTMTNERVDVRLTVQDTRNAPGSSSPASASRWLELAPNQPNIYVEGLASQARVEAGTCPVPPDIPESPLGRSWFNARYRQNGLRVMLPVRQVVGVHAPDYVTTSYWWSARNSGQSGGPDLEWEVPLCHCGEEAVTVLAEEQEELEIVEGTNPVRAPALDLVVRIELIDEFGRPIQPGNPAIPAMAMLFAETPDGNPPPGPCEWIENYWRDPEGAASSERPLDPGRLVTSPGACDAVIEIWRPDDQPRPWRKALRGVVRVESGPFCGVRLWTLGGPEAESFQPP